MKWQEDKSTSVARAIFQHGYGTPVLVSSGMYETHLIREQTKGLGDRIRSFEKVLPRTMWSFSKTSSALLKPTNRNDCTWPVSVNNSISGFTTEPSCKRVP